MKKSIYFALFVALIVASPRAQGLTITGNITPFATIAAAALPGQIAAGTMLDVYHIFAHSGSAANVTAMAIVPAVETLE